MTTHGPSSITIERALPTGRDSGLTSVELDPAAGAGTIALRGTVAGRAVSVFPDFDAARFAAEYARDPNRAFQVLGSPLFPLANRLRDPARERGVDPDPYRPSGRAKVLGVEVEFPLNHRAGGPGDPSHLLHGSLFRRRPSASHVDPRESDTAYTADFAPAETGDWSAAAVVTVRHVLRDGRAEFSIEAKNTGSAPMPVGFGYHPYFRLPSGDPKSARLRIPGRRVGEIDGFANVFPTGRWLPVEGSPFDFTALRALPSGENYDHFWHFDGGSAEIELHDVAAGVGFRLRGLTPNIMGAQFYYPGTGATLALELVTNLPDPRTEVWGAESTGMRLLAPGESDRYAVAIEVFAL
jgi:galactose mutarotase-like enzyme